MITPAGARLSVGASAGTPDTKDARSAARQFEALLITQMLRSARESGGDAGWLGTGEDTSAAAAIEMAEEHFAAALAAQGGLGLARMISEGLAKKTPDQRPK